MMDKIEPAAAATCRPSMCPRSPRPHCESAGRPALSLRWAAQAPLGGAQLERALSRAHGPGRSRLLNRARPAEDRRRPERRRQELELRQDGRPLGHARGFGRDQTMFDSAPGHGSHAQLTGDCSAKCAAISPRAAIQTSLCDFTCRIKLSNAFIRPGRPMMRRCRPSDIMRGAS